MESTNWVIQLLGVLGGGTVLTSIVVAISSRKKIGAEATEKITAAAGEQLDNMREELTAARIEIRDARAERNRIDQHNRAWWTRADRHSVWDRAVMRKLDEAGIPYDPCPSVYPPSGE